MKITIINNLYYNEILKKDNEFSHRKNKFYDGKKKENRMDKVCGRHSPAVKRTPDYISQAYRCIPRCNLTDIRPVRPQKARPFASQLSSAMLLRKRNDPGCLNGKNTTHSAGLLRFCNKSLLFCNGRFDTMENGDVFF
ncbi:hypothetical protein [Geobacillus subterraneus]|nr:hypothetical protein [Geobacillus subterraneus]